MTAAPPDRRAIITEALHKIDDLSARLEIAEKGAIRFMSTPDSFIAPGPAVQGRADRTRSSPGPQEEIPYVFERFWRSPGARSLPGSGLGLAIVAQAVEEADGKVGLETAPGGGALARLWLPGTPHRSSTRFS